MIKQYDEVRKVSTVQGDDYRTGCLLDCPYFQNDYKLIAVDVDPRVIRQIAFQGVVGGDGNTKIRLYINLEQSKETVLEFYKGTAKVL